jgi:hypothetical protein
MPDPSFCGRRGCPRPATFSTISGFFYFLKKSNSFHTSDKRVRKRDQKTHGLRFTENKKHNFSTKPTKKGGRKAPAFQREHLAARFLVLRRVIRSYLCARRTRGPRRLRSSLLILLRLREFIKSLCSPNEEFRGPKNEAPMSQMTPCSSSSWLFLHDSYTGPAVSFVGHRGGGSHWAHENLRLGEHKAICLLSRK